MSSINDGNRPPSGPGSRNASRAQARTASGTRSDGSNSRRHSPPTDTVGRASNRHSASPTQAAPQLAEPSSSRVEDESDGELGVDGLRTNLTCRICLQPLTDPVKVQYTMASTGETRSRDYDRSSIVHWIDGQLAQNKKPTDPLSNQALMTDHDGYPKLIEAKNKAERAGARVFKDQLTTDQRRLVDNVERAGELRNIAIGIVYNEPDIKELDLLRQLRELRPDSRQRAIIAEAMSYSISEPHAKAIVLRLGRTASIQQVLRKVVESRFINPDEVALTPDERTLVDNAEQARIPREFAVRYIALANERSSDRWARYGDIFDPSDETEPSLHGMFEAFGQT